VSTSPVHREISSRLESIRQGPEAEQAWVAGAGLSREEAIQYALEEGEAGSFEG